MLSSSNKYDRASCSCNPGRKKREKDVKKRPSESSPIYSLKPLLNALPPNIHRKQHKVDYARK
jgi:hypothetical protein